MIRVSVIMVFFVTGQFNFLRNESIEEVSHEDSLSG